jgi:hypothetical protein
MEVEQPVKLSPRPRRVHFIDKHLQCLYFVNQPPSVVRYCELIKLNPRKVEWRVYHSK